VVTGIEGLGYLTSLAGFAWYNQLKMRQIASGTTGEPAAKSTSA
jgi:hypothetical protein